MSEMTDVETMRRFVEAFNAHDVDAVMEFFSEDCTMDLPRGPAPWGRRLNGKEQVREGIVGRFTGIPDVRYGDDEHWMCGDRGVSRWELTGTTPAGEELRVRGCDLLEFRDGLVVRKDSYWKLVD